MKDLSVEILMQKFASGGVLASLQNMYVIFLVSIPLSMLLYLMFSKYRHYILVDLGHHKWLVK